MVCKLNRANVKSKYYVKKTRVQKCCISISICNKTKYICWK